MKPATAIFRTLLGILVIYIALAPALVCVMLTAIDIPGFFDYLHKSDFETDTVTVTVAVEEDGEILFSPVLPEGADPRTYNYVLRDGAYRKATQNGLTAALMEGETVTFRYHPAYLGDGWIYPIASLRIGESEYLAFDDGYTSVLIAQFWAMIGAIVWPSLFFFGGIALGCCVMGVRIRIKRPPSADLPPADTPTEAIRTP